MTTPRIAPVPPTGNPADVQELLDRSGVGPPAANIFRTMARHPGLMRRWLPFGGKLLMGGRLPARDRELLILRTAWNCDSAYEWGQHVRIGHDAGLSDEEIGRIAADPSEASWAPEDAALLRAADQLVSDHRLDEATWAALAQRYDDDVKFLIEVTLLVGHYAMLAGMLNTVGVALDDGLDPMPPR
jgi:4-carboxymuconolactone decarboxylase